MADRTGDFYAATAAVHGYGFQLMVGNGASPELFEAVAYLKTTTPGEASTDDIDRTHARSPGAHKEHMAGLRDSGAFTFEGIYIPSEDSLSTAGGGTVAFTDGGLPSFWTDRQDRNFKLVLNDGSPATEMPFRGYVNSFQIAQIGIEDVIGFSGGIQPTEAFVLP